LPINLPACIAKGRDSHVAKERTRERERERKREGGGRDRRYKRKLIAPSDVDEGQARWLRGVQE